jgi:hypothetical protein
MALLVTSVFGVTGCGSDDDVQAESRAKNAALEANAVSDALSKADCDYERDLLLNVFSNSLERLDRLDRLDLLDRLDRLDLNFRDRLHLDFLNRLDFSARDYDLLGLYVQLVERCGAASKSGKG